ncbi:cobalt-precorrin-7 (C(5))-methyltransferase [Sulfolobus sp. E5-1-F]|uniref:cobalt-precorrin-7 (C(5))-methyltransferase n=1 Tax=Sulfolobaceae TaxID=118883 RepID=UPI00129804D4|nr:MULTISPECIES: cobalt-precorrin-7 (C(5))-methyltransferase [unclassified Sulfolobus]QGA53459.1 cobalt-precorrin-7 (C(5))-methyltransferase [Sulfolobus sp. E5-1-F]QGA68864.1 cobalt-precorrin-7 (C(5))-methyltransferase [Sulfolobus sp. E11-6]
MKVSEIPVYIIGVGPGDPEYITLKGYKAIKDSSIVAGWESVLERFRPILEGKRTVVLTYKKERETLEEIIEMGKTENVAILDHGDPSVSDWQFVEKIKNIAASKDVKVHIISGVSSLNIALSRLGLDISFIGFVTLHVRGDISKSLNDLLNILKMGRVAVVIPEPYKDGPQKIAKFLYDNNLNCRIVIFEKLSYDDERRRDYDDLVSLLNENYEFSDLTIVAIFPKS